MTNPSRKRVVTSDDLDILNRNSAYARQQGEAAATAAADLRTAVGAALDADLPGLILRTTAAAERAERGADLVNASLAGTQAQRKAYDRSKLKVKTRWDVTESPYQTYWFTPGDTAWRDSSGNDPDYVPPPGEPDDGRA